MSHATDQIAGAIERSISHNEIVTVLVDDIASAFDELMDGIEGDYNYDYVDTRGGYDGEQKMREVWSTDDNDNNATWRVHLLQART